MVQSKPLTLSLPRWFKSKSAMICKARWMMWQGVGSWSSAWDAERRGSSKCLDPLFSCLSSSLSNRMMLRVDAASFRMSFGAQSERLNDESPEPSMCTLYFGRRQIWHNTWTELRGAIPDIGDHARLILSPSPVAWQAPGLARNTFGESGLIEETPQVPPSPVLWPSSIPAPVHPRMCGNNRYLS